MAMIRICDNCGQPVNTEGPLDEDTWVQVAVGLDEPAKEGHTKDYHRKCARNISVAEVWKRSGLIPL